MSKIRVDELINQSNSGPTLAVEGLRVPSTKSLVVEGIISLNGALDRDWETTSPVIKVFIS